MKIELKYEGKNYYAPLFSLLYNDANDELFAFGIKYNSERDYSFVIEDINNNFEKSIITDTTFYYYTKKNIYAFNLNKNMNLIPKNKEFSHFVVLLDKNDNIITSKCLKFTSKVLI